MKQKYLRLAPFAAALVLSAAPAHASGIVLTVVSVSAAAGSTNDYFDVIIGNTGSAQNVAAFSLGLSVGNSNITLIGADEATASTYVFNGDSFDVSFPAQYVTTPLPGQSLEGVDLSYSGAGTNLASSTLGLGRIYFDVASNAPVGPVTVTITPGCSVPSACTSLSDSGGANVLFSLVNGAITVTAPLTGAVPEPSTWLLALVGIPAMGWKRMARNRQRSRSDRN